MKRPWVVKAGGELLASPKARRKILLDLAKIARSTPVVFVHGGGPQIGAELSKQGIPAKFVNGRRITSPEAMTIIEQVLSGTINKELVAEMGRAGITAVGISGRDARLLTGRLIPKLGRAARPDSCRTEILLAVMRSGILPVVNSVGSDAKGKAVNINADDAASAIGIGIKAAHLVFLSDVPGVLAKDQRRIPVLRAGDIDGLIRDQVIRGGMIPKVQSAREALKRGVAEVDILDGFKGIRLSEGTRITK